jgi:hypothetical protein
MTQTKYGHLVKSIPPFKDNGQGFYRQGTEMNGKFLGYDLNLRYGTFYNSGNLQPFETQVCDYDQILIWMGTNTIDLGYLGSQVDFCLGEEKEKHRITTATAVSIPKGLPHFPASIGPLDDRFILMTISLAPEVKAKPLASDRPIVLMLVGGRQNTMRILKGWPLHVTGPGTTVPKIRIRTMEQ